MLTCAFLTSCCCVLSWNLFLTISFLFFIWNIKIPQQNIDQSQTEIGDKKLWKWSSMFKSCAHWKYVLWKINKILLRKALTLASKALAIKHLPFESNNRNTWKRCEICLKIIIIIKAPERMYLTSFWCIYCNLWTYFTLFIVLEQINFCWVEQRFWTTLNRYLLTENWKFPFFKLSEFRRRTEL